MRMMIAIDLSDATETIVNQAEIVAQALSAQVWLVHVAQTKLNPMELAFDTEPQEERDLLAKGFRDEHRQIQEISARLRNSGIDATALLVQGNTVETILAEATKLEADILAMGSHGKGLMEQLFVGSTSQGVLKQAHCPVLIIPTTRH